MGSEIKPARRAPALSTDCLIARFSTGVAPQGTQTMIFGFVSNGPSMYLSDEGI